VLGKFSMKEIGFQNDTLFMNKVTLQNNILMTEEFEDTKGAISIRISKKNIQHNGQKKKYKRTNNDLQNIQMRFDLATIRSYL
jgi:hypothetical protein